MSRTESQAGPTLLEVLGAFALLAILYTVLAGNAIQGVRSEGESRRRLQASLIADERLAEIELELARGTSPKLGRDEEELDGFRVATEVKPLEIPPRPEAKQKADEGSLAAKRAARKRREVDVPSLFAAPKTGETPALLDVDVVVRWSDGIYERELHRRTYALDPAAVDAAFEAVAALPTQQQPGEPDATEDGQGAGGEGQGVQQGQTPRQRRRAQREQQRKAAPEAVVPVPGEGGAEP